MTAFRVFLLVVAIASTNLVQCFVLLAPTATTRDTRHLHLHSFSSPSPSCLARSRLNSSSSSSNNIDDNQTTTSTMMATAATATATSSSKIMDCSTLLLLEHINLNVPQHDYILPFYFDVLGCGMDPRKAANLQPDAPKKTLWANCGASQFHLPFGETAQCIPGHIGLWYENQASLEALKERVRAEQQQKSTSASCIQQFDIGHDASGQEYVRLVDRYNNVFYCRAKKVSDNERQSLARDWKQPIITARDTGAWKSEIVKRFGRDETECKGIAYVEFQCPTGTADKIALFYDSVLDATTSVVVDPTTNQKIAVIALGNIDEDGRTDQSLLFRETDPDTIPPYDGHHVAIYVGESAADFEQAFVNAELAGVVWVNPRFSDKTENIQGARKWKQFRFKDILDLETGKKIFELEHEMRSVEHEAFPGHPGGGID